MYIVAPLSKVAIFETLLLSDMAVVQKLSANHTWSRFVKLFSHSCLSLGDICHKLKIYCILQLTDFGLSKYSESSLQTFCGTKVYMAPELFESTPRYGPKVDIWAFGTVIFIAIVGYPPFSSDYLDMPLRDQICKGLSIC